MEVIALSEKLETLAELYDDPHWADFAQHHNIAIPAAYLERSGFVSLEPPVMKYIDETWEMLLVICPLDERGAPLTFRGD